ncbi:MAG TPA: hypothetical protein VIU14_03615 [Mesorhizobium sp.]|jgi:hypothetical protein
MLLETNDSYTTPAEHIALSPVGNTAASDAAPRQAVTANPSRRRMGAAIECYISAHRQNLGRLS